MSWRPKERPPKDFQPRAHFQLLPLREGVLLACGREKSGGADNPTTHRTSPCKRRRKENPAIPECQYYQG